MRKSHKISEQRLKNQQTSTISLEHQVPANLISQLSTYRITKVFLTLDYLKNLQDFLSKYHEFCTIKIKH